LSKIAGEIKAEMSAPFPYFGGKSGACETVWKAFGTVDNYVEPFAGSAAMLLGAQDGARFCDKDCLDDYDRMERMTHVHHR